MPFTMEMDSAVFTKSIHRTPSDGDGRLERPMFVKIMKLFRESKNKERKIHQRQTQRGLEIVFANLISHN